MGGHIKLYRATPSKGGRPAFIDEVDAKLTADGYELDPDGKRQPSEWGHRTFIPGKIAKNNYDFIAFSAIDAAHMALKHWTKERDKRKESMLAAEAMITDFSVLGLAAAGIGGTEE